MTGEPARGQGHHEKKSELGRNSCVCGREKDFEHDFYDRERSPASTGTEIPSGLSTTTTSTPSDSLANH